MKTRLNKAEYETHVLQTLRHRLIEQDPRVEGDGQLVVVDIRLDTSEPKHMVEMLLWDATRPERIFGWRFPATEADDSGVPWESAPRGREQAEAWAQAFILTNLAEELEAVGYGLPSEYNPNGITWFGDYKPET